MKNLTVFSESRARVKLQDENERLLISAVDVEQNRIFFASSANIIYAIGFSASQETQWTINLCMPSEDGLPPSLEAEDRITGMDYRIEQEALIVGTSTGDLLLVIPISNMIEVVGRVEGGVKTIVSSPDGALLAVATGFGQLLVMTQDWDVLYEVSFDLDHNVETVMSETAEDGFLASLESLSKVQVSWRGDGKYFATLGGSRTSEGFQRLKIWERDSGALHSCSEPKDFMEAAMDWMPSGAKVSVALNRRNCQKCPSVVFFERNGLERGSFDIIGTIESKIEMLAWNCNSELLAVLVRCEEWSSIQIWSFSNYHWYLKQEWKYKGENKLKFIWDPEKPMRIIYWTACGTLCQLDLCWNSAVSDESTAVVIDGMNILVTPLSLSLVPPPMSLFNLKFQSAVQSVAFCCGGSEAFLAVGLSNGNLSVVKFPHISTWHELEGIVYNSAIVNMSSLQIEFGNVRHLTWIDSSILLGVMYCDADQTCKYSDLTSDNWRQSPPMSDVANQVSILVEIELVCNNSEDMESGNLSSNGWVVKSYMHTIIESPVVAIAANPMTKSTAFVQLRNGSVVLYTSDQGINMAPAELYKEKQINLKRFFSYCPWMRATSVYDHGNLKVLLFGLDEDGKLQVNGQIICTNCTSFEFYASATGKAQRVVTHLVYTTKKDLLFVVNVGEILQGDGSHDFTGNEKSLRAFEDRFQGGNKGTTEENKDALKVWERGAKLIGIINGDEAAAILQTVRGNLESIYPRKLVLLAIADALVGKRFRDAVSLVRQHRINFNVIVDYCGWQMFVDVASEFVRQVGNFNHITEFVCALKEENIMITLYKNMLLPYCPINKVDFGTHSLSKIDSAFEHDSEILKRKDVQSSENMGTKTKIQAVLEAVRKALEEQVSKIPARELCILTTLACNNPPELEEALKRIKKLREREIATKMNDEGASDKSNPSAEEALKHLLWLSDPDAVFQAALGLYDLHLAAIVALNSQRDPKEFLPFLQELEQMSPPIMCYTIDCKLHRYESALKNIASAGDAYFDKCLQLMKSNPKLFSLGVNIFKDSKQKLVVLEAWGDHLFAEEKFEESAIAYCSSSYFQKALGAFRAGGLWKEALTMAGMLKLTTEEVLKLAYELSEELQALGKPAEAAKITLDYCKDVQNGINLLVTAREWPEALRIGFLYGTGESVKSQVKVAAMECANAFILQYEEGVEKVGKYLARYLAVRQRRVLLAAKLQLEDKEKEDLVDDTASETSSNISGMSVYTHEDGNGSNMSVSESMVSSRGGRVRTRIRTRRKPRGGKIRPGSPGEEFALVEHLQSMALNSPAQEELKMLLQVLLFLGEEEIARKLQNVAGRFQSSQHAAAQEAERKLAEDEEERTAPFQTENASNSRKQQLCDRQCWQWKVLLPP